MGREREQAGPLSLKAAGFWLQEQGLQVMVWPSDTPTFLELRLVGQQSLFQRFLYYPKKGHKK